MGLCAHLLPQSGHFDWHELAQALAHALTGCKLACATAALCPENKFLVVAHHV